MGLAQNSMTHCTSRFPSHIQRPDLGPQRCHDRGNYREHCNEMTFGQIFWAGRASTHGCSDNMEAAGPARSCVTLRDWYW
jgi:hypothetical protein